MLNEYKTIATILEVKVKLVKKTLHQKLRDMHIENVFEGYDCSTSDENTIIKKLKYVNQLKKDLSSCSVV